MQQLSFTIPYTSSAIRATISALSQMDNELNGTVGLFTTGSGGTFTPVQEFREVPNTPAPISTGTPPPPPSDDIHDDTGDEQPAPEGSLDSAGLPWDARIHSSSRATMKSDGTWKLKKGVDKALVAQVTAELMGNVGTSATPSSVSTPPPPVELTTETVTIPTPPVPTEAAPVADTGVSPFRALLADITKAGLAPDYVQTTCMEVNGCTLPQCKDDVEKLSMLRMSLGL